jgi:hypothetical protein
MFFQMEKKIRFTFHSAGTYTSFNPKKMINDFRTDRRISLLDFYKEEVKFRNSPDVFVLDDRGNYVGEPAPEPKNKRKSR